MSITLYVSTVRLWVVPRSIQYTFIVQSNQRTLIVFVYITEFTLKEAESFDIPKLLIYYKFL